MRTRALWLAWSLAACYPREAPPLGPTPEPLVPISPLVRPLGDGGLPLPTNDPVRVIVRGQAAVDAGVDSAADLPAEVPDAGVELVHDAGQPL